VQQSVCQENTRFGCSCWCYVCAYVWVCGCVRTVHREVAEAEGASVFAEYLLSMWRAWKLAMQLQEGTVCELKRECSDCVLMSVWWRAVAFDTCCVCTCTSH
jgi:hypothetical protein